MAPGARNVSRSLRGCGGRNTYKATLDTFGLNMLSSNPTPLSNFMEARADFDGGSDIENEINDDHNTSRNIAPNGNPNRRLGRIQVERIRRAGSELGVQQHVQLKVILKLKLDRHPGERLEIKIEADVRQSRELKIVVRFKNVTGKDISDKIHDCADGIANDIEDSFGDVVNFIFDLSRVIRDGVADVPLHCQTGQRRTFDVACLADDLNVENNISGSSLSLTRTVARVSLGRLRGRQGLESTDRPCFRSVAPLQVVSRTVLLLEKVESLP